MEMNGRATFPILVATAVSILMPGCGHSSDSSDDDEAADETEPEASTDEALSTSVNCHERTDTAYVRGVAKPIK
jgi:hypothetical protein